MKQIGPIVASAEMFRLVKDDLIEFAGSEACEEPIRNEDARGEEADDAGAIEVLRAADFKKAFALEKSRDFDWSCGAPEAA